MLEISNQSFINSVDGKSAFFRVVEGVEKRSGALVQDWEGKTMTAEGEIDRKSDVLYVTEALST